MLQDRIRLDYADHPVQISLNLETREIFSVNMREHAEKLFNCYEQDILFLPKNMTRNVMDYLQTRYSRHASKEALDQIRNLEPVVFAPVKSQLDKFDFSISSGELLTFFQQTLDKEFEDLHAGKRDETLDRIVSGNNAERDLTRLLTQFSIEFLTEGCPMGLYGYGVFGELQSYLFKVYQDEMGNGTPTDKHSHLFEATMRDLGLSEIPHDHREYYLTSNYLISDYTFSICHDKRHFFRYLGAFFRNEACFINWQKLLGEAVREVFGGKVDCRYFDVHTEVDQVHGRWVLDNLVSLALKTYGDEVAGEMLRGYMELQIYQDLFDVEFEHSLNTKLETMDGASDQEELLIRQFVSGQSERLFDEREIVVQLPEQVKSGEIRLYDPLEKIVLTEPGSAIRIPKYTNAMILAE